MKVVLFCGGLGMRLKEHSENVPKPMVKIGYRPILWHLLKYYAHYGYQDFILCLGHGADVIKNYFLNYDECLSNDFVLSNVGKELKLINSDIQDWKITFVDIGLTSNIGQRLKAIEGYVKGSSIFGNPTCMSWVTASRSIRRCLSMSCDHTCSPCQNIQIGFLIGTHTTTRAGDFVSVTGNWRN